MKLVILSSELKEQEKIANWVKDKISGILRHLNIEIFTNQLNLQDHEGYIVIPATGGTEKKMLKIIEYGKPVLLWAIPYHNSLPAALEVYAYVKNSYPVEIMYSNLDESSLPKITSFLNTCKAIYTLKNFRFGCIGGISEWILSTDCRADIIHIDIDELIHELKKVKEVEIPIDLEIEVPKNELINSLKVYEAIKRIISKYNLSAITIKCFDLFKYGYSACLAMSLLNDLGIVAGCEGDICATYTMAICHLIANRPCWMANVCRINIDKNTITFAHCTIPTKMIETSRSTITTHMETGKFCAIRGELKKDYVTIVRFNGNTMSISLGKVIRSNMGFENLCRTQAEVELVEGNVNDFIEKTTGNHHILVYGDIRSELVSFCKLNGLKHILI